MENLGGKRPIKSFWQRPEGTPGMIFLAAAIVGAGIGLYHLLPYIITLLTNIYTALALIAGLGVIFVLATDKRFRTLLWYFYKMAMRKLTAAFVQIDPIGILETYVEDLHKKSFKMQEQITQLSGQRGKLKKQIDKESERMVESIELAKSAQRQNRDRAVVTLHGNKAARSEKTVKKLTDLYKTMGILEEVIKKMHKASKFMIEDTEDKVKHMKIEREAVLKSHSVMKTARAIIAGDNDKKMLFDQAMEYVVDDIGMKLGEMDSFMEQSQTFMENMDIQNGVFEARGAQMLEEWDKKISTILLEEGTDYTVLDALDDAKSKTVSKQKVALPARSKSSSKQNSKGYDKFL